MSSSFCTVCGHHMTFNALFCEACGANAAAGLPAKSQVRLPPHLPGIGSFFASQAALCLFTLLIFLGLVVALSPAGWRYASLQLRSTSGSAAANGDARSLGMGTTPMRCHQIVVLFTGTATVTRISALLEQLDTTIAFGPNENGAFELSAPSTSASGVTDALNRASDAVISASLQRRCL